MLSRSRKDPGPLNDGRKSYFGVNGTRVGLRVSANASVMHSPFGDYVSIFSRDVVTLSVFSLLYASRK